MELTLPNKDLFCRLQLHWWRYSWATVRVARKGRVVVLYRTCPVCGRKERHRVDRIKNGAPVWDEMKIA